MNNTARIIKNDLSLVLCGGAGQGIQSVEQFLVKILAREGFYIYATKEYMSRVRGGSNSTTIRISSHPKRAPVARMDILIPLDDKALEHMAPRLSAETVVFGDEEAVKPPRDASWRFVDIPFSKAAIEIGGPVFANMIAAGFLAGLMGVAKAISQSLLETFFAGAGADIIAKDAAALERGYDEAAKVLERNIIAVEIDRHENRSGDILINGAEAVALGALAGGCDFIAAYPMSPSTGVLTFLAGQSLDFEIVVEQAEDEIAAINMMLGAWYAGARAMVTTSGGGFALMEEALSLAGVSETPAVIHLAQRPGPATGLATRTEQADLNLVLYAGQGEFPRVIFAPGTLEEAAALTRRAFDLADRFQVQAFVLTDQYFMDTYYTLRSLDVGADPLARHIEETDESYRRYRITEEGVSPRGVPGFGDGLVVADSHEHTEDGHITENLQVRPEMVNKRLRKLDLLRQEALPPLVTGDEGAEIAVICWGSTYPIVQEALAGMARPDVCLVSFSQVYPLSGETKDLLGRARKIIAVEGNATGQFSRLIALEMGFNVHGKLLKYDGLSFTVEEVIEGLSRILSEGV
ncbi:MAG: 2-oxoacid:acceptor oxidoreductase subunit alpha [Deltaproteobacteria bacterium]|nr:2-oxoacid:acceptor oxidoreductase subunit alpha [Deltaproteobacteria bacterium]